jgi:phosphoribosylformylglycinamidine synthase subunit PurQ / glutaminase
MPAPRVCVLRAPGTNCDFETAYAFDACGGISERVHLFRLLEQPERLDEFQILCIPGGFSYGDDIGAGVVFGSQLRTHLRDAIGEFLRADKLVLGICNGFQVLIKAGILPGGAREWSQPELPERRATLTWNENGKYTALWVHLRARSTRCAFLSGMNEVELPIAHAEGRLVVSDPAVISTWDANQQIALNYSDPQEAATASGIRGCALRYPINPNGSTADIAGLCDPTGRVLGLMPHPERFLFATQHPQWTRRGLRGEGAGIQIFRNAVNYFRAS